MKKAILTLVALSIAAAISFGRTSVQSASSTQATTQSSLIATRMAKASNILDQVYSQTEAVRLAIYPPHYIDMLQGIANGTTAATNTMLDDPPPASPKHLKPGHKKNMHWLDAQCIMGSPSSEAERNSDESQHTAIISYAFYMGDYEVTQYEYNQVMGNNPSYFTSANGYTDDLDRPVESVTWDEANAYCATLTFQSLLNGSIPSGWAYRLPTEAEWEYSCRAQTAEQQATGSTAALPPYPVPWMNPTDGITYHHYWVGTSQSGYSSGGYVYYFNDDAPTLDPHGNATTVAANGLRLGTIIGSGAESAFSNPNDYSQGVEFGCSAITSGIAACSISGLGNLGDHWAWCPNQYLRSDLPVYSSLGRGLLYSPVAPVYTTFSFGDSIQDGMANFNDQYEYNSSSGTVNVGTPTVPYLNMTTNVGSYQPNGFGLYDMHGNVSEWCGDYYGTYPTATLVDYTGPSSGTTRVVRGGSWADEGTACRSAIRLGVDPSTASSHIGFRIVLAPATPEWKTAVAATPPGKTYGVPPIKSEDSLVLITHGWTLLFPDQSWINTMSNSIVTYLNRSGVTDWQVYGYYWESGSAASSPNATLVNAVQEGISLGSNIVNQGWTKVHFISHSLGAQVIQTATEVIKAQAPGTVVQCTFLDPYVGTDKAGQNTYGNGANWSDMYSSHNDIDVLEGIFTDVPLYSAYNVDVTALDPSLANSGLFVGPGGYALCSVFEASHSWSRDFYENSITGNITSDYDGFGFLLSDEAGGWPNAPTQYPVGNVNSVRNLGTAPQSCSLLGAVAATVGIPIDFTVAPTASKSTTGTITTSAGVLTLITGSPAWLSIVPTNTNPVNLLSFAANFTSSGVGAAGLLTVLWDTNVIGALDERTIGQGVAQYSLRFPVTESNSTHVLSFRLDPFTNIQSTIVLTNVTLGQVGVTQPFSLSVTTNNVNGSLVYQLAGQAGFDYGLQASTDLVNWAQIAVLENTNGIVNFSDQNSTNYQTRFYRAVAPY